VEAWTEEDRGKAVERGMQSISFGNKMRWVEINQNLLIF
jgi:hypothetical protein